MKKIRIILVGSLIVCALGLLTACNNTTGNNTTTKNNNGNGTITTTAGNNTTTKNNNGVMDDIKEGAEDIATDIGIDNDNNKTTTK